MRFSSKLFLLVSLIGCSKEGQGEKEVYVGFVNMQLENTSSSDLLETISKLEIKLVSAYVTQSNDLVEQGIARQTHTVFLNDECNEDLRLCDISGGSYVGDETFENIVTSYFDFTNPELANKELNAQNRPLIIWQDTSPDGNLEPPSDPSVEFTHAVLEFCKKNNEEVATVKWSAHTVVDQEYNGGCGISEIELVERMVVHNGDNIIMTVSYNLDSAVSTGPGATGDDCLGSGTDRTCFSLPTFLPSAQKVNLR